MNGRNLRFLVDSGADVTLTYLTTLKQFPERLRTEWKKYSLEIYAINGDKIRTWSPVQVNLEIKGVIISTQVYASDMLEPEVLGLLALKALRSIIDLEKEELLVKKPVEGPEFAFVTKTRRVLLNRGGVIELWAETTLQRKVSGNLSDNMEDWLVANKFINIKQSDCLFAARVVVFAEVSKVTNTEMDDKGNKMNKGCFEPMNEILKLPEVSLPEIVKQTIITMKKKSILWMFGSLKAERKRTTRLAKRIKAQIDTQKKVIRGVKEQLVHVVKEQKKKKQNKEIKWTK